MKTTTIQRFKRTNFTDRQKAELFVRERATCAYTGKNLWLLDHGCDPYYEVDWADHIVPASRGGLSTLANGLCASARSNTDKGVSTGQPILFHNGAPTAEYFRLGETLTRHVKTYFKSFAKLHYSDWYLNRALWRMWLGIWYLFDPLCIDPERKRSRDDWYYAKASFKILEQWKRIVAEENVTPFENRGLLPKPMCEEQALMLTIREATSAHDIQVLMSELLPYFKTRDLENQSS